MASVKRDRRVKFDETEEKPRGDRDEVSATPPKVPTPRHPHKSVETQNRANKASIYSQKALYSTTDLECPEGADLIPQ